MDDPSADMGRVTEKETRQEAEIAMAEAETRRRLRELRKLANEEDQEREAAALRHLKEQGLVYGEPTYEERRAEAVMATEGPEDIENLPPEDVDWKEYDEPTKVTHHGEKPGSGIVVKHGMTVRYETLPASHLKKVIDIDPVQVNYEIDPVLSEQMHRILTERLPKVLVLFMMKNADYEFSGDHLGSKGQYAELWRKVGKLKKSMWDGHALLGEQSDEILADLIGHCLLAIDFLAQEGANGTIDDRELWT